MKKSYPDLLRKSVLVALAGIVFLLGGAVSCVDVDNTLGEEYIPEGQVLKIARDSSFRINTYNVTVDSVPASMRTYNLLGGYRDSLTGISVNAGIVFEMDVPSFSNTDSLYGTTPVIDSAFLTIYLADWSSEKDVEQVFEVYELNERVRLDSVYYYDFDPEPIIGSTPLFTIRHTYNDDGFIRYPIEDQAFLNRLKDTTDYKVDSLFRERFKGFYIKPQTAHADAILYEATLNNSHISVSYHNFNEQPDTTTVYYFFNPYEYVSTLGSSYYWNQSINVVDRDYSTAKPELRLNDKSVPVEKTYIQGFGGIQTCLEFTKESIDALKAKVIEAGFKEIAVSKAKLEIYYPERDPDRMNGLMPRLGMYYDYTKRTGIEDFAWTTEQYYQQSQTYWLPYNGHLNRSRYLYEMDVTHYIQELLNGEEDKIEVYLGPSYEVANLYNMHTTELNGIESDTPVSLVLTYTMIR